jgi:hypothetical protein
MQRVFLAGAGSKMETAPAIPTMLLAAAPKLARAYRVELRQCRMAVAGCTAAPAPGPGPKREWPGSGHRAQSTADIAKRRSRTAAKSDHSFAHFAKPLDPPRSFRTMADTDLPHGGGLDFPTSPPPRRPRPIASPFGALPSPPGFTSFEPPSAPGFNVQPRAAAFAGLKLRKPHRPQAVRRGASSPRPCSGASRRFAVAIRPLHRSGRACPSQPASDFPKRYPTPA